METLGTPRSQIMEEPNLDSKRASSRKRHSMPMKVLSEHAFQKEELQQAFTLERTARKHVEAVADEQAKNLRVMEVSKAELVKKLLGMKIEMERNARNAAKKTADAEPSSLEIVSEMKTEITHTRDNLEKSNRELAEETRKNAVAAQELMAMNKALRSVENELRISNEKLNEAEKLKHDIMLRNSKREKALRSREVLSENRIISAEVQNANAQSMLATLEEKIAVLQRAQALKPQSGGTPKVDKLKSVENYNLEAVENNDPERQSVLKSLLLKNVDIASDLKGLKSQSFAVKNRIENDGDLHISEARKVLVDPQRLDPTVGAHMDYLTYVSFNKERQNEMSSDLEKKSSVHDKLRNFSHKTAKPGTPVFKQSVKDAHAAYAQFARYRKFQANEHSAASEKKVSHLQNEMHHLRVSKEKAEVQLKAVEEEVAELRDKMREVKLANEAYQDISDTKEEATIEWKVKGYEEITSIDKRNKEFVFEFQNKIKDCIMEKTARLNGLEGQYETLQRCIKALQEHIKKLKLDLHDAKAIAKSSTDALEKQKEETTQMEEEINRIEKNYIKSKRLNNLYSEKMKVMQTLISNSIESFDERLAKVSNSIISSVTSAEDKIGHFWDNISIDLNEETISEIDGMIKNHQEKWEETSHTLSKALKGSSSTFKHQKAMLHSMKEEIDSLKSENKSTNEQYSILKDEFQKFKEHHNTELKEKEEKVQSTLKEAAMLLEEVDDLTDRLMEKEKELGTLEGKLKSGEDATRKVQKSLEKAQKDLSDLQSSSESEQMILQERIKSSEDALSSSNRAKKELSKSLSTLEDKLQKMKDEKVRVEKELEDSAEQLKEAEASCEEATAFIKELKETHKKEKSEKDDEINAMQKESAELQEQVATVLSKLTESEEVLNEADSKQQQLNHEIAEARKGAVNAQKESQQYILQLKEKDNQLSLMESEKSTIEGHLSTVQDQLSTAMQQKKTLEAQITALMDEKKAAEEREAMAKSQKKAAEEREATAIGNLYDMESRIEYEKKRADGVVQAVSEQLNLQGHSKKATLLADFAKLQQQLEREVDPYKREELEERLGTLKLAMQYEESSNVKTDASAQIMELENKLETEREARTKMERELKEALDKNLMTEEENQMLLKEYEEVVEENKFLVSQIESMTK